MHISGEPAQPPTPAYGEVNALFDFPGQTEGDLAFTAGAMITLLEVMDEEWMRGQLDGREGVFPASFVQVVKPLKWWVLL